MERKLASLQVIKDIRPIENADRIEVCQVNGWNIVTKKDEFVIGDLGIFFEIDSLLDHMNPVFEFMRDRHFRVRTVKLRKQISQGLILPLEMFPEIKTKVNNGELSEGDDVTELTKTIKYEIPIPESMRGLIKGNFPGFLIKTDQERIQNLGKMVEEYKGFTFTISEKLDGTSFTAFIKDDVFGVCSRNLELKESDSDVYWKIAKSENIESKLHEFYNATGKNIAIQGEIIGFGIQGNKYRMNQPELYLFDIFDIDNYKYLTPANLTEFCYQYNLKQCPSLGVVDLPDTIDEILKLAEGISKLNPQIQREGIVFKPGTIIEHPDLGRLSFKAINNKFLLKFDE
jgi:RNA ligase (TIGR02306 family)